MGGKKGRRLTSSRVGDVRAMLRLIEKLPGSHTPTADSTAMKRQMVADWCRLLGKQFKGTASKSRANVPAMPIPQPPTTTPAPGLPPRVRQTLARLLAGDSEKQIAIHLQVSQHTVHVYVKTIYRSFDVNSRGELLSLFV